jgi:peptide deformylase
MRSVAILPMRTFPDPVLREKAKKVATITASLRRLIADMIDTMHSNEGVGIASNQVGVLQRVIVIQLPEDEQPRVFINPEITQREGVQEVEEGCLSIPGYLGLVKRSVQVRAKALNIQGKQVKVRASELLAQALEHEVDHLNGILYIDRLVSKNDLWKLDDVQKQYAVGPAYSG